MSLSDIMSAMRLNLFAEAAFVLAAAGFLTVLVTLFLRANRAPFERARVGGEEIDPFFNANRPEELAEAERLLGLARA